LVGFGTRRAWGEARLQELPESPPAPRAQDLLPFQDRAELG
jgi:hypothetical protein